MNENAALFFVDRNVNGLLKDKTAFIEYGSSSNSISYYDLYDQSSRLKNLFLKYKISREDRVIVLMNDVVQYPVIFWGCLKSGVIPVLLNTLLSNEIIDISYDGDKVDIGFNSKYIIDICNEVDGEEVDISLLDSVSPAIILDKTDENLFFVLMPMRI